MPMTRRLLASLFLCLCAATAAAEPGVSFTARRDFGGGLDPFAVAVGDFNNDNIPDIVASNFNSSSVSVLLGKGDGFFQEQRSFPVGTRPRSVAVGDFNL